MISNYLPQSVSIPLNKDVMRIKEMITDLKSFWLLNKFSLSAPEEIYGELYEEYALWC